MSNQHTWSISDAKTTEGETMIVGGPGQEFGLIAVVTDEADAKQIIADREARADAPEPLMPVRQEMVGLQIKTIEQCMNLVNNMRMSESGILDDPRFAGQRGKDRSDALYDVFHTLWAVAKEYSKSEEVPSPANACTCHPDDNPPVPCAEKYAYSECVAAPSAATTVEAVAWRIIPDDQMFLVGSCVTDQEGVAEIWRKAGNRVEALGVIAAPTTSPDHSPDAGNMVAEPSHTTASSAEPVADIAVPSDAILTEWVKWLDWDTGLSVEDEVKQLRFLYMRFIAPAVIATATPPSSGNADAVRAIAKTIFIEGFGGTERVWNDLSTRGESGNHDSIIISLRAAAALSSAPVAGEWQDISTAPQDQSVEIMICGGVVWYSGATFPQERAFDDVALVTFDANRKAWRGEQGEQYDEYHYYKPTHWQQKPPPFPRNDGGGPR